MTRLLITVLLALSCHTDAAKHAEKEISENDMTVSWKYEGDRIYVEMSSPSRGWVTLGFNEKSSITGAYLIMARVVSGQVEIVEHYTSSPGSYRPITELGGSIQVADISGSESELGTSVRFSLPTNSNGKYRKDLHSGKEYHIILAFSVSDDFQHHSIMRASIKHIL